jgi:peptidyl-prolyl cis-trans isomerase SurA
MQAARVIAKAVLLAGALTLVVTAGAGAQQGRQPAKPAADPKAQQSVGLGEGVAAVVNDEVVSTYDVRQRSALILASSGIPPTTEAMRQVRSQALRGLVDERLQIQEAAERKVKAEADEIDGAIANIARANNLSVDQFTKQLKSAGVGMQTLRTQIEAEILWRRLVNGRYGSRVRISSIEVQDTLARIQANASKPQYHMAEILLLADSDQEFTEAEATAKKLLQEMRTGRVSFAAVARQFSGAPSAAAGGDLGWLSEAELRPELQAAAKSLRAGQVSQPIRTEFGVMIVAVRETKDGIDARTAMKVRLQQISAPTTSRAALDRAKARIRGCQSIGNAIKNVPDVEVIDLGDMVEADIADTMRDTVVATSEGTASSIMEANGKVSTIVVCDRGSEGGVVPSRDQIEDRLYDQELAMLSQRYLMDLRRESTIITR